MAKALEIMEEKLLALGHDKVLMRAEQEKLQVSERTSGNGYNHPHPLLS